jgi:phage N-6-adenine-methyltransferase
MDKVHYSSEKSDWETPQDLFDELNREFNFTLDVCADHENAKCDRYITKDDDTLVQSWLDKSCWMNPPYGREIGKFIKKAYEESRRGCTVVCLLPARTDTKWFHDHILGKAQIRFLKGRLTFVGGKYPAPFPSMIVIYRPDSE